MTMIRKDETRLDAKMDDYDWWYQCAQDPLVVLGPIYQVFDISEICTTSLRIMLPYKNKFVFEQFFARLKH